MMYLKKAFLKFNKKSIKTQMNYLATLRKGINLMRLKSLNISNPNFLTQ
jgi:hypothetical protein